MLRSLFNNVIILFGFLSLNRATVEQWINNSVHRGLTTDSTGENKVGILNHNVHGDKYISTRRICCK